MYKIGLDIHGVIDNSPEFFAKLTQAAKKLRYVEVHIITGGWFHKEQDKLKNWGIEYDEFFSIHDYLHAINEPKIEDNNGIIRYDEHVWDTTKGFYCNSNDIDLMIDDTEEYGLHMPIFTSFIHYQGK